MYVRNVNMSTKIDQKKYLKKYLSKPDKKKKQKKKSQISDGIKIIDDDIGLSELPLNEAEIDLFASAEDAPQVVAVIDERPIEVRIREKFELRNHWQEVSEESIKSEINKDAKQSGKETNTDQFVTKKSNDYKKMCSEYENKVDVDFDSTLPHQRKRKLNNHSSSESDVSPPRKHNQSNSFNQKESFSNYKERKLKEDESLLKERNFKSKHLYKGNHAERYSVSPSGKNKNLKDKDFELMINEKYKQKSNYNSDASPPRRKNHSHGNEKQHFNYDLDASPLRRKSNFLSSGKQKSNHDSDVSPPRRKNNVQCSEKQQSNCDSDASPPRKKNNFQCFVSNSLRKNKNDDDMSPPRKYKHSSSPDRQYLTKQNKHELIKKSDLKRSHSDKLKKTLDGKVAGLQNSHNLKNELIEIKRNENDIFNKLSSDLTGVNAVPIVRDRKTGRIRDLEKEATQQKLKEERDNVQKEKYSRWGKGLKQVDDINEKIQSDLYEMSKPLARYADDADLENYLKNQEREGDPMLEYIRKEKEDKFDTKKSSKPQYKGSFMPNRFNIPPGYRWDGVDRSNGYEEKWFETINAKKAREEIAYKWSTEDM